MNADHRHVTQNGGLGMQFVDPRFNDGNDPLVNIVAKENREEEPYILKLNGDYLDSLW